MKNPLFLLSPLLAVLGGLFFSSAPLRAATFDLSASQVGGLFADGSADNSPAFQNYYVGYSTLTSTAERRNFFHFDLSTVTTPVVAAELSLTLTFGGLIFGTGDTIEEFVLSGTAVPVPVLLDPGISVAAATAAWDTLGDPLGLIGGVTFDTAMPPMVPPGGLEIVIPLNALGVDLINMNLGGELVLGGRMLDVTPLDPSGEMSELMFGLSDVSPPAPMGVDMPFLSLTEVPEPSAAVLALAACAFGLAACRRRP